MCAGVSVSACGGGDICERVCVRAQGTDPGVCVCVTEERILAQPE